MNYRKLNESKHNNQTTELSKNDLQQIMTLGLFLCIVTYLSTLEKKMIITIELQTTIVKAKRNVEKMKPFGNLGKRSE